MKVNYPFLSKEKQPWPVCMALPASIRLHVSVPYFSCSIVRHAYQLMLCKVCHMDKSPHTQLILLVICKRAGSSLQKMLGIDEPQNVGQKDFYDRPWKVPEGRPILALHYQHMPFPPGANLTLMMIYTHQ